MSDENVTLEKTLIIDGDVFNNIGNGDTILLRNGDGKAWQFRVKEVDKQLHALTLEYVWGQDRQLLTSNPT